ITGSGGRAVIARACERMVSGGMLDASAARAAFSRGQQASTALSSDRLATATLVEEPHVWVGR
ncbi:MAG: hypothetical protein AAFW98_07400, partial [Pseudomonadota bacterium]